MAKVVFWEKPGCRGNARQKEILAASGHQLEVRDLLAEDWTADLLARFFGDRPVREWFSPSHPRIKSGDLDPATINPADALMMMVKEPLLIVRPLLQVGKQRLAGFEVREVHNWIGLALDSIGPRDPRHCPCVTGQR